MKQQIEVREMLWVLAGRGNLEFLRLLVEGAATGPTAIAQRMKTSQAIVSCRLARLRHAGLVIGTRHGKEVHYTVNKRAITECINALQEATGE